MTVKVLGDGITTPGSYRLRSDSRIIDLIQEAGGLKPGAITEGLRWNQPLYDGLKLTIPTHKILKQVAAGTRTLRNEDLIRFRPYRPPAQKEEQRSRFIDLNQASKERLMELHGIGDVLADRIIEYRDEHDGFDNIKELKNVFGIGEVTFQKLRAKARVR